MTSMHTNSICTDRDDYITIIAHTPSAVIAQFKARHLDEQGYTITGRIGRHSVSVIGQDGTAAIFNYIGMFAATFYRPPTTVAVTN